MNGILLTAVLLMKANSTQIPVKTSYGASPEAKDLTMAATKNSTKLPASEIGELLTAMEGFETSLGSLYRKISPELKKAKNAVAVRRKAFINETYAIVSKNNAYMPGYLTLDEFSQKISAMRDVLLMQELHEKIGEYLRNADILVCNDAYRNSLSIYKVIQDAAKKGHSDAKALYLRLKKFFPNSRKQKEENPITE
jgi:hypothetical protein